jgi:hypothetical protein
VTSASTDPRRAQTVSGDTVTSNSKLGQNEAFTVSLLPPLLSVIASLLPSIVSQ